MAADRNQSGLPAAEASTLLNNIDNKPRNDSSPRSRIWTWTCDECGDGSMTILIQCCPQCQHPRCNNCTVTVHPERQGLPLINSEIDIKDFRRTAIAEEISLVPLHKEVDSNMKTSSTFTPDSDTSPNQSNSLFSAEFCHLSRKSSSNSSPFSYVYLTEDESEVGSEMFESDDDITGDEARSQGSDYALSLLESHLFSVVGHDRELATRLIPHVLSQVQLDYSVEGLNIADSPHDGDGESGRAQNYDAASSVSAPSNTRSSQPYLQSKRRQEDDEAGKEKDHSGEKRRRKYRDRDPLRSPRFACHFYKKDSNHYCRLNDRKFGPCQGPGPAELRHMKKHYLEAHTPSQCQRCCAIIQNSSENVFQGQESKPCERQHVLLNEGINHSEWEKIKILFRVPRGLSEPERRKFEYDKWFEIWSILFPDCPKPTSPWYDTVQVHPSAAQIATEGLLARINTTIDLDFERGILQYDNPEHQLCRQRFERALRVGIEIQAALMSQNSPASLPHGTVDSELEFVETPFNLASRDFRHASGPSRTVPLPALNTFQDRMSLGPHSLTSAPSESHVNFQTSHMYTSQALDVPNMSAAFEWPFETYNIPQGQQTSTAESSQEMPDFFRAAEALNLSPLEHFDHDYPFSGTDESFPFDENQSGEGSISRDSSWLTNSLEMETEDPLAMAVWRDNHDRNLGLQQLPARE